MGKTGLESWFGCWLAEKAWVTLLITLGLCLLSVNEGLKEVRAKRHDPFLRHKNILLSPDMRLFATSEASSNDRLSAILRNFGEPWASLGELAAQT